MLATGLITAHGTKPTGVTASTHLSGKPLDNRQAILHWLQPSHGFVQGQLRQRLVDELFSGFQRQGLAIIGAGIIGLTFDHAVSGQFLRHQFGRGEAGAFHHKYHSQRWPFAFCFSAGVSQEGH